MFLYFFLDKYIYFFILLVFDMRRLESAALAKVPETNPPPFHYIQKEKKKKHRSR